MVPRLARRMDYGGRNTPILEGDARSVQVPVARKAIDGAVIRDLSSAEKGTRPSVGIVMFDAENSGAVDDGLCLTGVDDVNVVEQDPAEDDGDDARKSRIALATVPLFTGK